MGFYYNQPGFYYNQQPGFYYDQQPGFYYDQGRVLESFFRIFAENFGQKWQVLGKNGDQKHFSAKWKFK